MFRSQGRSMTADTVVSTNHLLEQVFYAISLRRRQAHRKMIGSKYAIFLDARIDGGNVLVERPEIGLCFTVTPDAIDKLGDGSSFAAHLDRLCEAPVKVKL